ncbi:MAG: hypothetical protein JWQ09_3940 [Segetibacter sp.]|nr:hypothetical protein [Segetibacter sp.]
MISFDVATIVVQSINIFHIKAFIEQSLPVKVPEITSVKNG